MNASGSWHVLNNLTSKRAPVDAKIGAMRATRGHPNLRRERGLKTAVILAAFVCAAILAVPAFATGNAGTTQVGTFPAAGVQFTCSDGTTYTALGGTVHSIMHDSFSANGAEHITGTISPTGVTLTDGTTSAVYALAGATWFGGNLNQATGQFEFGDTGFFNIIAPGGGVVGKVAGVEHASSGGANFSFNFGACQAPQD